jgi:hypothetical protein
MTASAVVISVSCLVALSACGRGSGSGSESSSDSVSRSGGSAAQPGVPADDFADAPAGSQTDKGVADQLRNGAISAGGGSSQAELLIESALIKTGAVSLESNEIGRVLTRIYSIVASAGGDVAKEDTTTDRKGAETRSLLEVRVPVDQFESTVTEIADLGILVSKARSSKDVTTEVADIDSRVKSAQRSIETLRSLFSRASRLGDIIRIESELSQRESDLESLESQQRALADKTTMSTITVTIDLPPTNQPKPLTKHDDKAGGFVSGIKKGWDALKTTVLAVGQGLGLVLPLGIVLLVIGTIVFWGVRRWVPARPTRVAEDGPSAE